MNRHIELGKAFAGYNRSIRSLATSPRHSRFYEAAERNTNGISLPVVIILNNIRVPTLLCQALCWRQRRNANPGQGLRTLDYNLTRQAGGRVSKTFARPEPRWCSREIQALHELPSEYLVEVCLQLPGSCL